LQYAFSPSFIVRGEVERYRVRDAGGRRGDVDLASVSLVFPFGQGSAPQRRAQTPMRVVQAPMAPPPVVAPPAPPPVAAPAPAPARVPAPQRVSYGAESLFGFDTAAMRAEAVKAHLVQSGRVDPGKIIAVGLGAAQPVTKPGECAGTRRTAQLVACLQADRRVEIEVVGTR
jgi:OOP family OmpA-OmpF porin